jgi:dTDP-4-dehydrorhamnose reductase
VKILILGGTGMLGHRLWLTLSKNHEVYATVRVNSTNERYKALKQFESNTFFETDITNLNSLERILCQIKPDVVFNCVGIIKQLKEASDSGVSLEINSLLPHKISELCDLYKARFIHFSTDCVFDGIEGGYTEDDTPSPYDLYGQSKLMGEVRNNKNALTIRTSIIGRELNTQESLIEWFLSQKDVKGFDKAIFSGFPTYSLSKIIEKNILTNSDLHGVVHVSSDAVSKFDLLSMIKDEYDLGISISKDSDLIINRALNSEKFQKKASYTPIPWKQLVKDLLIDDPLYS